MDGQECSVLDCCVLLCTATYYRVLVGTVVYCCVLSYADIYWHILLFSTVMYWQVLSCIVLYYLVLPCTAQNCHVLSYNHTTLYYHVLLYAVMFHYIAPFGMVLYAVPQPHTTPPQSLCARFCQVDDGVWASLQRLRHLQELDLSKCYNLQGGNLDLLASH